MPGIASLEPFKPMQEDNRDSEPIEYIEDTEHMEEVPAILDEGMGDEQSFPDLDEPTETTEEQSAPTPPVIGGVAGWMLKEKEAEEQRSSTAPEAALPAEAQGETNGGPLGCCFGVIVGLVLSLVIVILSELYGGPFVHSLQGSFTVIIRLILALVAIAGMTIFGYFGWKIGKKVFREYEPPVVKDRSRKPKARTRPKPKGI